jgi:phosphoglycerate dehydrogenase-like enzyme
MKKAVFLGPPDLLAAVYPREVREALAGLAEFPPADIGSGAWRSARSALADAELIMATWGMPPLDEEFLAAAPRLRAVFYAAGTVKQFATPAAAGRDIVISSAAEANGAPVAEYCLAVILLSLKTFWAYLRQPDADKFTRARPEPRGVFGATIGLVSLGFIGRRLADLLARHEVRVIVHDPYASPAEAARHGVTLVSLPEVFAASDVVSVHTPWIPETEGLIGDDLLRRMKPGATFINTSRGAVVDEAALVRILRDRADLTAILDVTHPEPPVAESLLRSLPNVILTPHIAGSMGCELSRLGWWMLDEVRRHLAGQPLQHRIFYDRLHLSA